MLGAEPPRYPTSPKPSSFPPTDLVLMLVFSSCSQMLTSMSAEMSSPSPPWSFMATWRPDCRGMTWKMEKADLAVTGHCSWLMHGCWDYLWTIYPIPAAGLAWEELKPHVSHGRATPPAVLPIPRDIQQCHLALRSVSAVSNLPKIHWLMLWHSLGSGVEAGHPPHPVPGDGPSVEGSL